MDVEPRLVFAGNNSDDHLADIASGENLVIAAGRTLVCGRIMPVRFL
jgi:hypothetical protein